MSQRTWWRLSTPGALAALLFYSASLQPSLLPRTWVLQGLVSGLLVAIGYGIGIFLAWLWRYLQLPSPSGQVRRWTVWIAFGVAGLIALVTMWQHLEWQNDQRALFGMNEVSVVVWLLTIPATMLVAILVVLAGRGVRGGFRFLAERLGRVIGPRLSRVLAGAAVIVGTVLVVNGLASVLLFGMLNNALAVRDGVTPSGVEQPTTALRSGSPDSLVAWESMGRQGRTFVATGPTVSEISSHNGIEASEPIRVYVGLKSADDARARAELALAELRRTKAFERDILVLATTTGTGYVDPMAADSLEVMFDGDTAIAGMQYSYLPSWMSLMADERASEEAASELFKAVHPYWASLPEAERPQLYLFGMSLGSFGVESVLGSVEILDEPIDGVMLVGPPFVNEIRNELTENRDEGSPEWLPVYQGGETVRFISTDTGRETDWDGLRLLYMQHASDPMSFFSLDLAWAYPNWLRDGERGPDVSGEMWWVPVATMLQVAFDLPSTGAIPRGHGHLFTGSEYVDAWVAVIQPPGWTTDRIDTAKAFFANE